MWAAQRKALPWTLCVWSFLEISEPRGICWFLCVPEGPDSALSARLSSTRPASTIPAPRRAGEEKWSSSASCGCAGQRETLVCFCASLSCVGCVMVFLCSAAQWGSAGIRGFIQAAWLRPHGPWTAFTSALSAGACVTAMACVCAALTAAAIQASLARTAPFQMCQTWISWRRISKVQKQTHNVFFWHDTLYCQKYWHPLL